MLKIFTVSVEEPRFLLAWVCKMGKVLEKDEITLTSLIHAELIRYKLPVYTEIRSPEWYNRRGARNHESIRLIRI